MSQLGFSWRKFECNALLVRVVKEFWTSKSGAFVGLVSIRVWRGFLFCLWWTPLRVLREINKWAP